jgi:hypothetical protein
LLGKGNCWLSNFSLTNMHASLAPYYSSTRISWLEKRIAC